MVKSAATGPASSAATRGGSKCGLGSPASSRRASGKGSGGSVAQRSGHGGQRAPRGKPEARAAPGGAGGAGESAKKLGSVMKCCRCNGLSTQKRWFRTTSVVDKRGTKHDHAMGPACFECGTIHEEFFNHLGWEAFCEACQGPLLTSFEEAKLVNAGAEPTCTDISVNSACEVFVEVRSPVQILNEQELKKALGVTRLPQHLKSVPTLNLPKAAPGESQDDTTEDEKVYCFLDPQQSYRTACITQRFGCTMTTSRLPRQMWEGQASAQLSTLVAADEEKYQTDMVLGKKKDLKLLSDFVDERVNKSKKKGGAAAEADVPCERSGLGGVANGSADMVGGASDSEGACDLQYAASDASDDLGDAEDDDAPEADEEAEETQNAGGVTYDSPASAKTRTRASPSVSKGNYATSVADTALSADDDGELLEGTPAAK